MAQEFGLTRILNLLGPFKKYVQDVGPTETFVARVAGHCFEKKAFPHFKAKYTNIITAKLLAKYLIPGCAGNGAWSGFEKTMS